MTTTVTIAAHCVPEKEVRVTMTTTEGTMPSECAVLQDGETISKTVFDDRIISITEVVK